LPITRHNDASPFTPASGQRLPWAQLPARLRRVLEVRLGAQVEEALTQPGGFSPGLAASLRLVDGRRIFLKAVSSAANPASPNMHRREARIAAALPAVVPTPRFLWSHDDGDWVALAFQHIDGHPPQTPWRQDELRRVLAMLSELAELLTPSPIAVESIAERLRDDLRGWRRLQALNASGDELRELPDWVHRHLDRLAALEAHWEEASTGETLVHFDLRADNILITPDRVLVVDWPHAARGAAWLDLVEILPSIAMQHGPPPWQIFDTHPLGRIATHSGVTAVVAALAGYFAYESRLPPPPGLPTLRAFQRDQGRPALEWLQWRTGWA
jgi:aminoglycoside phosphotransferase (APT) family kinase protein